MVWSADDEQQQEAGATQEGAREWSVRATRGPLARG
jgi:hypothetical protein